MHLTSGGYFTDHSSPQLLLDLQQLKACLLRLPGPPPPDSNTQTSYAKGISKSIAGLETLLKVIIAPTVRICFSVTKLLIFTPRQSPPEAFVANYTLLVGDSSFANFQKVGHSEYCMDELHGLIIRVSRFWISKERR